MEVRKAAFQALPTCFEQGGPKLAKVDVEVLASLAKDADLEVRQALPTWRGRAARSSRGKSRGCSLGSPPIPMRKSARQRPRAWLPVATRATSSSPRGSWSYWATSPSTCCGQSARQRPRACPPAANRAARRSHRVSWSCWLGSPRTRSRELATQRSRSCWPAAAGRAARSSLAGIAEELRDDVRRELASCEHGGLELAARVVGLPAGLVEESEFIVRAAAAEGLLLCGGQGGQEVTSRVVECSQGSPRTRCGNSAVQRPRGGGMLLEGRPGVCRAGHGVDGWAR